MYPLLPALLHKKFVHYRTLPTKGQGEPGVSSSWMHFPHHSRDLPGCPVMSTFSLLFQQFVRRLPKKGKCTMCKRVWKGPRNLESLALTKLRATGLCIIHFIPCLWSHGESSGICYVLSQRASDYTTHHTTTTATSDASALIHSFWKICYKFNH